MSNTYDLDDDLDDEQTDAQRPSWAKELRQENRRLAKEAKRAQELEQQLQSYQRADALRGAALNLTDRQRKALEATHDGEWTPEALRATAVDLGWAQPPPPDTPPTEQAALERITQAAASETSSEVHATDRIASAQSPEEVLAAAREAGVRLVDDF